MSLRAIAQQSQTMYNDSVKFAIASFLAMTFLVEIYTSAKYLCTKLIAIDPSPTADATRFIAPARTSPAAKIPMQLVSNRNGSRFVFQILAKLSYLRNSRPVSIKPLSSLIISNFIQSVKGFAPINTYNAAASLVIVCFVLTFISVNFSRQLLPDASAISVSTMI